MHGVGSRAGLLPVDTGDTAKRGAKLKRRRNRHGLSERALADAVKSQGGTMDRATIKRAEAGIASSSTYDRLEAWFDDYEEQVGDNDVPAQEQIEVEFRNVFGIGQVIYRGSPENFPDFEAAIERLVQRERERHEGE